MIRYEYWRGAEPRHYYTMAVSRDARAFIEHQVSEHHVRLAEGSSWSSQRTSASSGSTRSGHTDAPATAQLPLEPGADAITRDYYERFPVVVGQWWGAGV